MNLRLERLAAGQHLMYRDLRLAALKESPDAFGTSYGEAMARDESSWKAQSDGLAEAADRAAFLAYDGASPVGLMAFYGLSETRGEVMQVWVSPKVRGKGAARMLLERLLRWARAQGFREADVRAKAYNSRAIRFYEKTGFRRADLKDGEVRLEMTLE